MIDDNVKPIINKVIQIAVPIKSNAVAKILRKLLLFDRLFSEDILTVSDRNKKVAEKNLNDLIIIL